MDVSKVLMDTNLRNEVSETLDTLEKSEQNKNIKTLTQIFSEFINDSITNPEFEQLKEEKIQALRYKITNEVDRLNQHIMKYSERNPIFIMTADIIRQKFNETIDQSQNVDKADKDVMVKKSNEIFNSVTSKRI